MIYLYKVLKSNNLSFSKNLDKEVKVIDYSKKGNDFENENIKIKENLNELREIAKKTVSVAQETAEEILKNAREKHFAILKNAKENARNEIIRLKEDSYLKGIETGKNEVIETTNLKLNELYEEFNKKFEDLKADFEEFKKDTCEQIFNISFSICEKVLDCALNEDENLIKTLIINKINGLKTTGEINLIISNKFKDLEEDLKNYFKENENFVDKIIFIKKKDIDKNKIIIDTKEAVFDCSLDTQIDNIKDIINSAV